MAWMTTREALRKIPEVFFQNRFAFTFDGIPIIADQLTLRKKMNLLKLGISSLFRFNRTLGLPAAIQVEPSNICNLRCPLCPAGEGRMNREKGVMSFETYQKILDELGDVLLTVYLYSWGEPFLNTEIFHCIKESEDRNIKTLVLTNGHYLQSLEEALAFVDTGGTGLIIAMDGSTQEIYQRYRKGGDLEKVKRCAALVEEAKAKRQSNTPYTCLRALVTRDTQDDLPNMEKLARELGVNMFSYKTVGMQTYNETFKDFEPSEESLRRFKYEDTQRKRRPSIRCPFPFRQPTIQWDGTVVGCEYDYDVEMPWGNIGEEPFRRIWNNPQAKQLRRRIRDGERGRFCQRLCPYQDRVQNSSYLSCTELRRG
jgi:MoaA/NifB/PqqE/SkfB family radical SAM enzyme